MFVELASLTHLHQMLNLWKNQVADFHKQNVWKAPLEE